MSAIDRGMLNIIIQMNDWYEEKGDVMLVIMLMFVTGLCQNGTFSIVAVDLETGEYGVAVASRVPDVGYIVPWLEAGVGAVATQASANPYFGPWALSQLRQGMSVDEVLKTILNRDSIPEYRQIGIVDRNGRAAAHTGSETMAWAGHRTDSCVTVQGNILTGSEVVDSMLGAYLKCNGVLAEKLLFALEAGERAGGDKRGKQSAALYVVRKRGGYLGVDDRLVDIKVLDNEEPVQELRRLYQVWQYAFLAQSYLRLAAEEPDHESLLIERTHALLLTALEQGVDDAEIYNNLAWAFALRKLYPQETLEAAQRAQRLAPEAAHIMDTLAEAYFASGDYAHAVLWEERALEKEPGNDFYQQQLEKFRSAQGREP